MEKTDMPAEMKLLSPALHPTVWVAPGARVIGNVSVAADSSIWYNAVLRGDINAITIGQRCNIQDGVVIHLENDNGVQIEDDVTVGHGAILHGCHIESAVVVGMGAVVLNGAHIGAGSVIGAGAVVPEYSVIPPCSLVVGVPGRIVKTYDQSIVTQNAKWAAKYVKLATVHSRL